MTTEGAPQVGYSAMALRRRDPRITRIAEKQVRGLTDRLELRSYWPEANPEPLFEVRGPWMTVEDLRWLRDRLNEALPD
jgi:hypothetical protein